MAPTIRIIKDGARDPSFNMAADRFLFDIVRSEKIIILRIYSWSPPAVSLGRMQDPDALLDRTALGKNGVGHVVRPTGGRAVLHWNDLTYALAFPQGIEGLGCTIGQSYGFVSRCLMHGLTLAGIPCCSHASAAEYAAAKRNMRLSCFLSPNRNEIMAQGKKLVGSAQKRTDEAVLQHGSLPLDGSFRRLPEFLMLPDDERERQRLLLEKKCACVKEMLERVDPEKLSDFLIKGFSEILELPALEKPWGKEEIDKISISVR